MLRIRIVSVSVQAAIAVITIALAIGGASARAATSESSGNPLPLLAGLTPPHDGRVTAHAKTATRTNKKAVKKLAAGGHQKLAARKHHAIAAADSTAQPAPSAAAPTASPAPDATPPADFATAPPPDNAPPDNAPQMSAVVVGGETVQVASPNQVNALDLAADDTLTQTPAAVPADGADAAPAAQTVLAAPLHQDAGPDAVGSTSWIAQAMAALGGAVAAGAVAWFLIGSGPVRIYG
jgi:hypothetical protein